jgi:transposase InsO family protein
MIREVIAALKLKKRKRFERRKQQSRESIVVHDVGTMTAMDAAALKKGEDFIVYRDRKSLSVKTTECHGHQNSDDTIGVLTSLKDEGCLPLVLCTDNGSPFVSEKVETYLRGNKVVHLKSLPHVPQHNGSAESAVKDVKLLTKDGIPRELACVILNEKRRRMKLNYKTSNQVEQENLKLVTIEERALFFEATSMAIKTAVLGIECAHEKRKAERKAIFDTLESFSLITINRGLRHA